MVAPAGGVAGLDLYNKLLVAMLLAGLAAGLAVGPASRVLVPVAAGRRRARPSSRRAEPVYQAVHGLPQLRRAPRSERTTAAATGSSRCRTSCC